MSERFEVEVKAACPNSAAFKDALEARGLRQTELFTQKDVYFNHPGRDFAATDEALRLRECKGIVHLTYKGPKVSLQTKARVEYETELGDFAAAEAILLALGFVRTGSVCKERATYPLPDGEICIDQVSGLGCFVEIEKIGGDLERLESDVLALAAELGVADALERRSYIEMLLAKAAT